MVINCFRSGLKVIKLSLFILIPPNKARDKLDPKKSVHGEVKNGVLVRSTKNYEIDIYGDTSNKVSFRKWELNDKTRSIHSQGNTHNLYRERHKNLTDTIYISGPYEITTRSMHISGAINVTFNGEVYASTIEVNNSVWKFEENLSAETFPAQTFKEISKFVVENSNVGILADSIYKNIDPYDLISLREGFILDAQRNGLDISYLRNEKITMETVNWNYGGGAYGQPCVSGEIRLAMEDHYDRVYIPYSGLVLSTMFHEMGHAALNLAHNTVRCDIMGNGRGYNPTAEGDILNKFRERTRRMFQNIDQITSGSCGFASQNGDRGSIVD